MGERVLGNSRDAKMHLKMIDGFSKKGNGRADGPTDQQTVRPSYGDAGTHLKTSIMSIEF